MVKKPGQVFLLYHKEIQQQGINLKLSSRSSKWIFLRNFPFQPMSQDKQFGVLIHSTRYGSQLWFLSQLPNLTHNGVGWKIPTRNSEEHDYIKPHLNTTECKEKQMFSSTQMEENHTFQFAQAVDRNESLIPTIASLPDTLSKVPDRSPTVKKSATPSTPMEPLRSTRITKGVPPKWLIMNWCNRTNQLFCIYQCEIGS